MYEDEFKRDMLALKVCYSTFEGTSQLFLVSTKMTLCVLLEVIPPAVYLRVTENVPQIVAFIEGIIKNGHAYSTQGGEYVGALKCKIKVGHLVRLQAMCILTLSPSANATAGLEELLQELILNQNPVSCLMSEYEKQTTKLKYYVFLVSEWLEAGKQPPNIMAFCLKMGIFNWIFWYMISILIVHWKLCL